MRALLASREITAFPGQPFSLSLQVSNTSDVIDSVYVSLDGAPGAKLSSSPPELPLFPGASGVLNATVELPKGFRAGRYEGRLTARSRLSPNDMAVCEFSLVVEPVTQAALCLSPATRSGHRRSRFSVSLDNTGNTDLEIELHCADPERALRARFLPPTVSLAPATSAYVTMAVQAPRKLFGSEHPRQIVVTALARPMGAPSAAAAVTLEAKGTYVQKPRVPRGVVTALVLVTIVSLWAGIFTVALKAVLTRQSVTKSAPLSFFAAVQATSHGSLAAATSPALPGSSASAAPAGYQPKNVAPAGTGGVITGNVSSLYEPEGVGRVTAQAYLVGAKTNVPVSAATGPTGDFQIVGLFPGTYKVAFTAPGFQTIWYPGTSSAAQAVAVPVNAGSTRALGAMQVTGDPGSLSGVVLTGETPSPPVKVTALVDNVPTGDVATAGPDGHYALQGLATPATYTLAFSAPGFQQSDIQVFVDGGQAVVANTVQLTAGTGQIEGTVTDGKNPLGGVSISASANGQTFASATATAGPVGFFSLPLLPTPATYLLTFTKQGFGTQNVAVALGPGQILTGLDVAMVGGTGTVSGLVSAPGGQPLGGVTVQVGGLPAPVSTQTLTGGSGSAATGTYSISGLPTPGTYAVTFSLPGYSSVTQEISLSSNGLATGVDATLAPVLGQLVGNVDDATTHQGISGVTISLTDGTNSEQTFSASTPSGGYKFVQLPEGAYTVTFSAPGYVTKTALVHLHPGQSGKQDIELSPIGSGAAPVSSAPPGAAAISSGRGGPR
ncbi:MAG TPA: carboxypeptidase regulatory-like domain-containing protein [Acidimicrobiales bacterium]|nr:carboxypeptidase regulatory-like domain-containing protein [Acidimicrobiales bacterium]